jgi:hypothetical protein
MTPSRSKITRDGKRIRIDFSNVPSTVAIELSKTAHTDSLAKHLASVLELDQVESQMIRDCLIGATAEIVDLFLPKKAANA